VPRIVALLEHGDTRFCIVRIPRLLRSDLFSLVLITAARGLGVLGSQQPLTTPKQSQKMRHVAYVLLLAEVLGCSRDRRTSRSKPPPHLK
jgi:hypothetical protein